MTSPADAICGYARRVHRAIGDTHHVASPLGAWLVLALAAAAGARAGASVGAWVGTDDDDRARLRDVLGIDAERAEGFARELLTSPHPAIELAAAAWRRADAETPELRDWFDRLAGAAETGDLPSQSGADAWAGEHTGGLIRQFPLRVGADTLLVLASALACAVDWAVPFDVVDVAELALARSAGFARVRRFLRQPAGAAVQTIVSSQVGLLGVHAAPTAAGDLLVVSVIADEAVPFADVLDHAHAIAVDAATGAGLASVSLFDLPLRPGPAWTVTERVESSSGGREHYTAALPAWSASSDLDLTRPDELGFAAAGRLLNDLLPTALQGAPIRAEQLALARYTRTGFQAAAVTAVGVRAMATRQREEQVVRTAALEFVHPYAVVAVATGTAAWAGLPVFSAWVSEADEPA